MFLRAGELGYHEILVPKEYGGANEDHLLAAVWVEEMTRIGSGGVAAGYQGFSTLIVEKGMPGFIQGKPLEKLGWQAGDTAELIFEDVAVPAANLLGAEGRGFHNAMANLEWELLIMGLGAVYGSALAFERTKNYVRSPFCIFKPQIAFLSIIFDSRGMEQAR